MSFSTAPLWFWNPFTQTLYLEPVITPEGMIAEKSEFKKTNPEAEFDVLPNLEKRISEFAKKNPHLPVYRRIRDSFSCYVDYHQQKDLPWTIFQDVEEFSGERFFDNDYGLILDSVKKDREEALLYVFDRLKFEDDELSADQARKREEFVYNIISTFPNAKSKWLPRCQTLLAKQSNENPELGNLLLMNPAWDSLWESITPNDEIYRRNEDFCELFFQTIGRDCPRGLAYAQKVLDSLYFFDGPYDDLLDVMFENRHNTVPWLIKDCPLEWKRDFFFLKEHFWFSILDDTRSQCVAYLISEAFVNPKAFEVLSKAYKSGKDLCTPVIETIMDNMIEIVDEKE